MDISSVVAAILFVISNVLNIILLSKYHSYRRDFSYETFTALDPTFIQEQWSFRIEHQALQAAAAVMNAVAWFSLMVPIFQVAWLQQSSMKKGSSTRHLGLHMSVSALALGGSLSEFIAALMLLGFTNTAQWIAKDFNLDDWLGENSNDEIGWRSLEVVFVVLEGLTLWVGAMEWLALFGITTLLFLSIQRNDTTNSDRLFSTRWSYFGLLLGTLSLVDFVASVLRFQSWRTFTLVTMSVSAINRLLILPIWLVWLGRLLPKAKSAHEVRQGGSSCASPANGTESSEGTFATHGDPSSSLS